MLQENGTGPETLPESGTAFSELDLALIDALQADPRASWTRVGSALGVDATTAARHWDRLVDRGLAWVTAYAAPGTAAVAYLEVRCRPGAVQRLSEALAELPWVFSIEHVVGDYDLFLSVCAADLPALGRLTQQIGAMRGVRATRTRLALRHYLEGGAWQTRALAPDRRAALTASHGPDTIGSQLPGWPYDATELALLLALGEDGRAGYAELAVRTGVGESTVRRRLNRQLRRRGLLLRCDLAQQLAGWTVTVSYRAVVPHGALDRVGLMLGRLPQTRLCASVTGSCNLLFSVWLHGTHEIGALEALLDDRAPELSVQDRTVTLQTVKRMGRILDPHGRAVRHVPLMLPPDPAADGATGAWVS